MQVDMLPHLWEIKRQLAAQSEKISTIERAVSGPDGEGGIKARVTSLELDRVRLKTAASIIGFIAGSIGSFLWWAVSQSRT